MASNARTGDDHGHFSSSDDDGPSTQRAKRRKGPKACDVCRRKKSMLRSTFYTHIIYMMGSTMLVFHSCFITLLIF